MAALSRFIERLIGRESNNVGHSGRHNLGDNSPALNCNATYEGKHIQHCFHCVPEISEPHKSISIMVVEQASGRFGSAHLHHHCTEPSLSRYGQTIDCHGQLGNIETLKGLQASWGSVPVLLG
jgi:hypothetical protein